MAATANALIGAVYVDSGVNSRVMKIAMKGIVNPEVRVMGDLPLWSVDLLAFGSVMGFCTDFWIILHGRLSERIYILENLILWRVDLASLALLALGLRFCHAFLASLQTEAI